MSILFAKRQSLIQSSFYKTETATAVQSSLSKNLNTTKRNTFPFEMTNNLLFCVCVCECVEISKNCEETSPENSSIDQKETEKDLNVMSRIPKHCDHLPTSNKNRLNREMLP